MAHQPTPHPRTRLRRSVARHVAALRTPAPRAPALHTQARHGTRPPRRFVRLLALLPLLGALALAGCAQRADEDNGDGDAGTAFPVTVEPAGAPAVTLDAQPQRIVSLVPSVTETLYEVGAGDQVVAVDEMSTHPAEAPRTELSGIDPDPQQIASHDPDLVVVGSDAEDKLAGALSKTGAATLVLPAPETLRDAYAQFTLVGKATGHADAGRTLADETEQTITELAESAPDKDLSYYHEVDPTYYTITSATFLGEVYDLFGLRNVADQDDPNAMGGYPQLSAEKIVEADPDLVFLADTKCCGQNADTVAERPGWDTMTAVEQDRVFALDDDIASRWSPRLVEFVRVVADAVAEA
ncbi:MULTISPECIES: ABC transporter substrate-binding protein [Prauserella salsuginis group]|uniref:ABC transporter substrate-binding protein n=1 Tax=Prauserella salsuginis TaxID=387889 RepID=A0ABW6GB49_9PSEU|nr:MULTISPECIES: ABC transporter substrate-binding protein [Prauserella salsuginis group]MCR3719034.1 iron complex transport system substrate-binding protein [Prauserella flava]MCR3733604.1 iron complex transport system substrate-binding protein [Prauserella salsuginis]